MKHPLIKALTTLLKKEGYTYIPVTNLFGYIIGAPGTDSGRYTDEWVPVDITSSPLNAEYRIEISWVYQDRGLYEFCKDLNGRTFSV